MLETSEESVLDVPVFAEYPDQIHYTCINRGKVEVHSVGGESVDEDELPSPQGK